jgi:hypothetical protein
MSNIRFIDSQKIGTFPVESIQNNVSTYLLTATGVVGTSQGEPELQFDSLNLAIGGAPSGNARLEVYHIGSVENIMLIRNTATNTGIKVDNVGRLSLLEFPALPTPVEGGFIYADNEFYVGI